MAAPPILRSPPFFHVSPAIAAVSRVARTGDATADPAPVFAAIRDARVGGCFWGAAIEGPPPAQVLRPRSRADLEAMADAAGVGATVLAILPRARWARAAARVDRRGWTCRFDPVDPWSVLNRATLLRAHGDDEWVALARIVGAAVDLRSDGAFGHAGDDEATAARRIADRLVAGVAYRDPFAAAPCGIARAIEVLGEWRRMCDGNRGLGVAAGIAWWKRREVAAFLSTPGAAPIRFVRSERRALALARRDGSALAVWPSRVSADLADAAAAMRVPLVRVEDGFVRSVGLGSNLVPPLSIVADRRGIHFDPAGPSDLEHLLATADFPPHLTERAAALAARIVARGISKYGGAAAAPPPRPAADRRIVLVPGQVEDDLSVRHGGHGIGNLDLLRRTRVAEPDAEIWFRPHPDVEAGHRAGAIADADALARADRVVRGGGMAPLLDAVDAVHVLTSLTGFEALLRGRAVVTHGTPFYAGWGLTTDLSPVPARRGRHLTLAELVAAVLILYPRYLDPVTRLPCPPETLIDRIASGAAGRAGALSRLRAAQGRLMRRRG